MEINVESKEKNPLMDREEFQVKIDHEGEPTPSEKKVIKKFSAENDLDPDKVEVVSVRSSFGTGVSSSVIRVYEEKIREETEEPEEEEPEESEEEQEQEESEEEQESEEEEQEQEEESEDDEEPEEAEEPEEDEEDEDEESETDEDEEDKKED